MEHCEVVTRNGGISYWHCKDGSNNACETSHDRTKYGLMALIVGLFLAVIIGGSSNASGGAS